MEDDNLNQPISQKPARSAHEAQSGAVKAEAKNQFGLNGAHVYGVDVPEQAAENRNRSDRDAQLGLQTNGGSEFRGLRTQDQL